MQHTDRQLRELLTSFRDRHLVPALGAGVITTDGDAQLDAIGVCRRDSSDAAGVEDLWHIGSCGKSITAACYARLVERGDAAWSVPLPELLPDLAAGADTGWRDCPIDAVFTHRSGIPANLTRGRVRAAFADPSPLPDQRTDAAAAVLRHPPRRPGRFHYSNLGYIVIGAAIERITGLAFEDALITHVLDPLEISARGFGPPPRLWGHGGRVGPIPPGFMLGRGRPTDPRHPDGDNPPVMSPAGRLHLSLADWAKFQRMILRRGGDFLGSETIERLLTPAPGPGLDQAMGWAPARGLPDVSLGQQGSNTRWVATAMLDAGRARAAMVVCNDGRTSMLNHTARLAASLLAHRFGEPDS